jgi:hypothetical protein
MATPNGNYKLKKKKKMGLNNLTFSAQNSEFFLNLKYLLCCQLSYPLNFVTGAAATLAQPLF